jgi:proteic killer suppression protein
MNIVFGTSKLKRTLCSEKELVKTYGPENAKKIKIRMAFLQAAKSLAEVPVNPPFRRHQLEGRYKGCFAVDLKHPFRLIFEPNNNPVPVLNDGGFDLAAITEIKIISVEDYH